jgi:hypothetical protein
VVLQLKSPYRDGTTPILMSPLAVHAALSRTGSASQAGHCSEWRTRRLCLQPDGNFEEPGLPYELASIYVEYSIAGVAHFGWMRRRAFAGVDFGKSPNVARWYESVSRRSAVSRAIARVASLIPPA